MRKNADLGEEELWKGSGDGVHPSRARSLQQVKTGAASGMGVPTLRLSKPVAVAPIYYLAMLVQNLF